MFVVVELIFLIICDGDTYQVGIAPQEVASISLKPCGHIQSLRSNLVIIALSSSYGISLWLRSNAQL